MGIKITEIKRIKKSLTDRPMTIGAVALLANKTKEWVKDNIRKAEALLQERNNLRKAQGVKPKQRIDEEIMEEVLNC